MATGTVQVSGSVTANGAGDPKLGGGYGAGGGVLIDAPKVVLGGQASMTSLGGGEDKDNGGTVKVFAGELEGQQHVRAGRLLVRPDE